MTPLTDADQLPPVQYLILELLAARIRTGEQVWSFPDRLRPQLRKLAEAGLIGWQSSPAPGACHAWFLDPGRTLMLLDDFQTPVTRLEKALEELHGRLAEARAELARYAERLDQLAAVEQDRDRLQSLFPLMIDELEDLSKGSCWRGPLGFASCDNGGCTHRRALLSKARALVSEPTGTEAKRLPHAPCRETGVHLAHSWGDPARWCDGSGEAGA